MTTESHPASEVLTLSEAAAACPKLRGRRLHASTLWRWCRRGCKARNGQTVRLAHRRVGGTLTTTRAELDQFFTDLANADLESFRSEDVPAAPVVKQKPPHRSPSVRRTAIARAEDVCKKAGI